MDIIQERLQWRVDSANVDKFVNDMVQQLKQNPGLGPEHWMAVDMVFRGYLQWVHSAQVNGIDAFNARESVMHVINCIILELAGRMGAKSPEGTKQPLNEWIHEFMEEMVEDLSKDVSELMQKQQLNS